MVLLKEKGIDIKVGPLQPNPFMNSDFPCRRLKELDKRYHTRYHMSIIDNLNYIKEHQWDG